MLMFSQSLTRRQVCVKVIKTMDSTTAGIQGEDTGNAGTKVWKGCLEGEFVKGFLHVE